LKRWSIFFLGAIWFRETFRFLGRIKTNGSKRDTKAKNRIGTVLHFLRRNTKPRLLGFTSSVSPSVYSVFLLLSNSGGRPRATSHRLLVARVKLRGSSSLVWTRRRGSSSLAAGVRARTRELLPGGAGARERLPVTDYGCARKMEWGLLTDG